MFFDFPTIEYRWILENMNDSVACSDFEAGRVSIASYHSFFWEKFYIQCYTMLNQQKVGVLHKPVYQKQGPMNHHAYVLNSPHAEIVFLFSVGSWGIPRDDGKTGRNGESNAIVQSNQTAGQVQEIYNTFQIYILSAKNKSSEMWRGENQIQFALRGVSKDILHLAISRFFSWRFGSKVILLKSFLSCARPLKKKGRTFY